MIKTQNGIHILIFLIITTFSLSSFKSMAEVTNTSKEKKDDSIDRKKIQTANVDKAMKYYKEHNMDIFSELVQSGVSADPNAKEEDLAKSEKIDEEKYAKGELLSDSARLSAINQAKILLSKVQSNKMKAELLARMGSLSYKRAKTSSYFEMNKYKVKTVPGYKLESSTKMYKEAIKHILEIEKYSPNYDKLDRMYFEAAICHEEIKERNKAFNLYKDIEKRFSDSEILPEDVYKRQQY